MNRLIFSVVIYHLFDIVQNGTVDMLYAFPGKWIICGPGLSDFASSEAET